MNENKIDIEKFINDEVNFLKVKSHTEGCNDLFIVCDELEEITEQDVNDFILNFDSDLRDVELYDPSKQIIVYSDKISTKDQERYLLYKYDGWIGVTKDCKTKYYSLYFIVSQSNVFTQLCDFRNIDLKNFRKYDSTGECLVDTTIYEILNGLVLVSDAILFKSKKLFNNQELISIEDGVN